MRKTVQIEKKIKKDLPKIALSEEKIGKLADFLGLLEKWNSRINLTAVKDFDSMVVKHLLDSLIVLEALDTDILHRLLTGKTLDIGSGAGFPGTALAICMPEIDIWSIDKNRKKIAFQETVKRHLALDNFHPKACRMEDLNNHPEFPKGFEVIISRAFDQIKKLLYFGNQFLNRQGTLILWKGQKWKQEMDDAETEAEGQYRLYRTYQYRFSDKDTGGVLLVINKLN